MDDISPKLLKAIEDDFNSQVKNNKVISMLQDKIVSKKATYKEANEYAIELGKILAKSYQNNLSSDILPNARMYYNIAQKVVDPTIRNNYLMISKATVQVQKILNEKANINLKVQEPKLNEDRIRGIVQKIADSENYDDVKWVLDEPIVNFSQSVVDDTLKANAEFHSNMGLSPKVVRKVVGRCCQWCSNLAGTYSYPDVPRDVYRRHERCRCTVTYDPADGSKKVQDVWSKKWNKDSNQQKIKERVNILETQSRNGKIVSGAKITDPNTQYANEWASAYYEEIRHKSTDHIKVAERMKISVEDAKAIKEYLFVNESLYDEDIGVWTRFNPDAAIAQSWQRLAEGQEIFQHDKTLIDHELLEMKIKKENPGISHTEAHSLAEKQFNYGKEAKEYYDNLNKSKKKR